MRPAAHLNAHKLLVSIRMSGTVYVHVPSLLYGSISNLSVVKKTRTYSKVVPHRWRLFPLAGKGVTSVFGPLVLLTGPGAGTTNGGANVDLALPFEAASFSARFAFASALFRFIALCSASAIVSCVERSCSGGMRGFGENNSRGRYLRII